MDDAELSAAQDAALGKAADVPPEEPSEMDVPDIQDEPEVPEEPTAEPGVNQERSNLGRKVQGLDEKMNLIMYQLQQVTQREQPRSQPEADEEDDVDIITNKDLPKQIQKYQAQQAQKREQYKDALFKNLAFLGQSVGDDEWQAASEMINNHVMRSDYRPRARADVEAETLFNKALNIYYRKKMDTKINPLAKNAGNKPSNLGGNSKTASDTKSGLYQLKQKEAIEFAKQFGMSPEEIDKAMRASE